MLRVVGIVRLAKDDSGRMVGSRVRARENKKRNVKQLDGMSCMMTTGAIADCRLILTWIGDRASPSH